MYSGPPALFIGEFDEENGPTMIYVSEYHGHVENEAKPATTYALFNSSNSLRSVKEEAPRIAPTELVLASGKTLLGKYVATGGIQPDCASFSEHISSRVFSCKNNENLSISIYRESSSHPAVGCLTFDLDDSWARGKQRRFCMAWVHPSEAALMSASAVLQRFSAYQIHAWKNRCSIQCAAETPLVENAEWQKGIKGNSGCMPSNRLRSFSVLIEEANKIEGNEEGSGLEEFHSFSDIVFPLAFATSHGPPFCEAASALDWKEKFEMTKKKAALLAASCVIPEYSTNSGGEVNPHSSGKHLESPITFSLYSQDPFIEFLGNMTDFDCPPHCKMLGWWLSAFLFPSPVKTSSKLRSRNITKLTLLLTCLFQGTQIVVSGSSAEDTAYFVAAMALLLPPELVVRSIARCYANAYFSPNSTPCRLISFSSSFLKSTSILPFSRGREGSSGKQNILDTAAYNRCVSHSNSVGTADQKKGIPVDLVLHVLVKHQQLLDVMLYGTHCSPTQASSSPSPRLPASSLAQRLAAMVEKQGSLGYRVSQQGDEAAWLELRTLDAQMHQVVTEYQLRSKLFYLHGSFRDGDERSSKTSGTGRSKSQSEPQMINPSTSAIGSAQCFNREVSSHQSNSSTSSGSLPIFPQQRVVGGRELLFREFLERDRPVYAYLAGSTV